MSKWHTPVSKQEGIWRRLVLVEPRQLVTDSLQHNCHSRWDVDGHVMRASSVALRVRLIVLIHLEATVSAELLLIRVQRQFVPENRQVLRAPLQHAVDAWWVGG